MKIKSIALLLALCLLSGCSLARPEAEERSFSEQDMMIGVFVTQEYLDLFDFDSYLEDNLNTVMRGGGEISPENAARYAGRLYAEETENGYDFGVEGMGWFCVQSEIDGVPSSSSYNIGPVSCGLSTSVTDEGVSNEYTGTVYVQAGGFRQFYVNPVYQDSEGRVYLMAGSGISTEMTEGMSMSQTLSSRFTETVDGSKRQYSMSAEVTFKGASLPAGYSVLHMARDGQLLQRDAYTPETLPNTIEACEGAEYLIIETVPSGADGEESISREIVNQGESYCSILSPTEEKGILAMRMTEVIW